jgi:hypothetical protein
MKKYFTIFLIICFLLNICGCYTNTQILSEDYSITLADPEEDLEIKLTDGRTIISKEYEHLEVKKPSEFIFGKGDIIDGQILRNDIGIILFRTEIDSIDKRYYPNNGLICWSNGKRYSFSDQNYFYLTEDYATGFWVKGTIAESNSKYYGRLNPSEIKDISIKKIDAVATTLSVAGILVVSAIIVYVIALATNPVEISGIKIETK